MPVRTIVAAVLVAASVVAGCRGGRGASTDSADSPTPSEADFATAALLPRYAFTLSDTGTEADRLVVTTDFGEATPVDVIIDSRIEPTLGTFEFASRTVTFTAGAVAAESDFGPMVIDILDPIVLPPGRPPQNVTIEITMALEGFVSVRFGEGFVELQRAMGPVRTLTVDAFEALLADRVLAPVWQHQSALGWIALDLLRELVVSTADAVVLIDSNLEEGIVADVQCDPLPGTPLAGVLNQGLSRLTWLGAGRIGAGDNFTWDHTSCWLAGTGGRGTLFDGRVNLTGLAGATAAGTVTQIGFRSVSGLGGVLLDGLERSATREPGPGTIAVPPEQRFVLNNGIQLIFNAP